MGLTHWRGSELPPDTPVARCHRWCARVVGDGASSVEPGTFEGSLELGFDLVGDVAVDLDDTSVHAVTQPAGLGHFGDACGDEPGFVAILVT